ncbi:MAG: heme ABC exporter ATP-binding protein CcmA [Bauldia sp.]|nr:heme ABC exporter ATP-binding protein CcmA [Bauldia sp.]
MQLAATDLAVERAGRRVLADISFVLKGGQLLTVTGPNGAGKSTLLRAVAGLLRPVAGKVSLDPAPDGPIGLAMHYFGHLDALKPAETVVANLEFWRRLYGPTGIDPFDALDRVGIGTLEDLPASYLSAGQRRRLAIARLLVSHRPVWLLDEPTASLDAASDRMMGALIAEHLAGGGLAVAASHLPLAVPATATLALGRA